MNKLTLKEIKPKASLRCSMCNNLANSIMKLKGCKEKLLLCENCVFEFFRDIIKQHDKDIELKEK